MGNRDRIASLKAPLKPLGRLASTIRKGIFDINASNYSESGIPFVRISNLHEGLIDDNDLAFIPEKIHAAEFKTALRRGDIILSKTAFAAASLVNLDECNISQDLVGVKLRASTKKQFKPEFVVSFLNAKPGLALMEQFFRGNIQEHLGLEDAKRILIPEFSNTFQDAIEMLYRRADKSIQKGKSLVSSAAEDLFVGLELDGWLAGDPNNYSQPFSVATVCGRFDAEYFRPRYQSLMALLRRQGKMLRDFARLRETVFTPQSGQPFHYIEIGDLSVDGSATSHEVLGEQAPSRATWVVQPGDVITSTVRPIRCLTGLIASEQAGHICSSGFAVLTPKGIPSELLFAYLRLPVICELMDLHTTASMYPAISTRDLMRLPFLLPDEATIKKVKQQVTSARVARREAHELLERARRAVEVAIEKNEAAGMAELRN